MHIKLDQDEIEKLKTDDYVVLKVNRTCCENQPSVVLDNISNNPFFRNFNLKKKIISRDERNSLMKVVIYNKEKVSIKILDSVAEIISFTTKIVKKQRKGLVFRGHKNANYRLVSSLLRNPENISRESEYYYDIIKAQPEWFYHAKYHLDYLKVMQHYFADTRIMDVSTNILPVIYFAVEDKFDITGEIIIFDKTIKPEMIKRLNSDTVEILASLAALDYTLKENIRTAASYCNQTYSNKEVRIKKFNRNENVKKLVHEVGQVRLNFSGKIDPKHLFKVYFSDSTFDNERITNQAGEFLIHGFIEPKKLNKKLNSVRYLEKNKKLILLIDNKEQIKEELDILGIRKSTIYPSLEHTITDIMNE